MRTVLAIAGGIGSAAQVSRSRSRSGKRFPEMAVLEADVARLGHNDDWPNDVSTAVVPRHRAKVGISSFTGMSFESSAAIDLPQTLVPKGVALFRFWAFRREVSSTADVLSHHRLIPHLTTLKCGRGGLSLFLSHPVEN